jgi:hypothetical protein
MQPADGSWLDEALGQLAEAVTYPPAPDVSGAVAGRVAGRPARSPHSRWLLRGAVAAALALVAAVIAVAASEDARDAVADFLGFGVAGERIELSRTTPTPTTTPLPRLEGVVEETTLERATAALGFGLKIPEGAVVERVFLLELFGLRGAVLRTPGYDLWQFRNDGGVFLGKGGFYGSTAVEELTIGGEPAYWITGGPRVLVARDAGGREVTGTHIDSEGRALLFARGAVTFRIEGDISREEALAIAATIE